MKLKLLIRIQISVYSRLMAISFLSIMQIFSILHTITLSYGKNY